MGRSTRKSGSDELISLTPRKPKTMLEQLQEKVSGIHRTDNDKYVVLVCKECGANAPERPGSKAYKAAFREANCFDIFDLKKHIRDEHDKTLILGSDSERNKEQLDSLVKKVYLTESDKASILGGKGFTHPALQTRFSKVPNNAKANSAPGCTLTIISYTSAH